MKALVKERRKKERKKERKEKERRKKEKKERKKERTFSVGNFKLNAMMLLEKQIRFKCMG